MLSQNLDLKTDKELADIADALEAEEEYKKWHMLESAFPDTGEYARSKYPVVTELMAKGATKSFRCCSGGNRTGKSFWLGTELAYHVLLDYPTWWIGKRFNNIRAVWIVAESGALYKDSLQKLLFGEAGEDIGTGLLPLAEKNNGVGIISYSALQGTPGGIGGCIIRNKKGKTCSITIKTNEMKREMFQAAKVDIIAFDEEPRLDIYEECSLRLMAIGRQKEPGIAMFAFTPLKGLSNVVLQFLPGGVYPKNGCPIEDPDSYIACLPWKDAPHLSEVEKARMLKKMSVRDISARTEGIPALGSGRIYPVEEEFIKCPSFSIPDNWPRAYGLDFGWHNTACVWMAEDPNTHVRYVYSEYKEGQVVDYLHVQSIKNRGDWIPGAADPSGGGRKDDGTLKITDWRAKGLKLEPGINAFLPGTSRLLNAMESGAFKVMAHCVKWFDEFRTYRYDLHNPNNAAPKQDDHELDATRYVDSIFDKIAISQYEDRYRPDDNQFIDEDRDDITGY